MVAEVQLEDAHCVVSRRDGIVVIDILDAMNVDHVRAADALADRVAFESSLPVGVFVRVAEGTAFPTVETRYAFVAFLKAHRTRGRTIHVVLEGRGFWAATMKALASTIARAVPLGPSIRLYGTVDEAASRIADELCAEPGATMDRAEIATIFRRAS